MSIGGGTSSACVKYWELASIVNSPGILSPSFVSLRDLKGYSELTAGYSCLRGEM